MQSTCNLLLQLLLPIRIDSWSSKKKWKHCSCCEGSWEGWMDVLKHVLSHVRFLMLTVVWQIKYHDWGQTLGSKMVSKSFAHCWFSAYKQPWIEYKRLSSFIFLLFLSRQMYDHERKSDKSRKAVMSIHLHNIMLCSPMEINGNKFILFNGWNRIEL